MSNIIDLKEKIDRLVHQSELEEEDRRNEIGRRAEDYVHRYMSVIAISLAITSIILAVVGLVINHI